MKKIAIIGAGISGLVLANHLQNHDVTIIDKSRGVGGRMATRRADPFQFDHGAQFFNVTTDAFKHYLEPFIKQKIIEPWNGRFVEYDKNRIMKEKIWGDDFPHYVGSPSMSAFSKALAQDLNLMLNTNIHHIEKKDAKWQLYTTEGQVLADFDWVILAIPAQQAEILMPKSFKHFESIASTQLSSCYSLMLGFDHPLDLPFEAALVKNANISWMSVNNSKPGRPKSYSLVVHSTNQWADQHINTDKQAVLKDLIKVTSSIIERDVSHASHQVIHRWRFANIAKQVPKPILIDNQQNLAACGDWCIQGRVEAAFTSAIYLAQALKTDGVIT